jgi:hypothetical protein
MLLVRTDSAIKTFQDLLAAARARPGQISFGHAGNGTSSHLAGELVKYMAKVSMASVPYRGGAPALNVLIGGHIPLSVNNVPEAKAQIDAGAVRPLGVTTAARSQCCRCADHRRGRAAGYDTGLWWGVLGARRPAACGEGQTRDRRGRGSQGHDRAQPPARARRRAGNSTPEEFAALIRTEYEKWGRSSRPPASAAVTAP